MGKAIIIKGADFSANAVEQIGVAIPQVKSLDYVLYLDYQSNSNINQLGYNSPNPLAPKLHILVADVTDFVGEEVLITSQHSVVSGANYACFTDNLGDLTFGDIQTLGSSSQSAGTNHAITIIESFNVSTVNETRASIVKTVPSGAKYLIVTGIIDTNLPESEFKVIPNELA